jgi:hypothetical protein
MPKGPLRIPPQRCFACGNAWFAVTIRPHGAFFLCARCWIARYLRAHGIVLAPREPVVEAAP